MSSDSRIPTRWLFRAYESSGEVVREITDETEARAALDEYVARRVGVAVVGPPLNVVPRGHRVVTIETEGPGKWGLISEPIRPES